MDSGEIVKRSGPKYAGPKEPPLYAYGAFDVRESIDRMKKTMAEEQKKAAITEEFAEMAEGLDSRDATGIVVEDEYVIVDGLKLEYR